MSGLVVTELRISCLVHESLADKAMCVLHEAFGLGETEAPMGPRLVAVGGNAA